MSDIARSTVFIVSAPDLSQQDRQILSDSGCVLWNATQKAEDLTRSSLLRALNSDRPNYVEVTCSDAGLTWLRSFLPVLTSEDVDLRQALPPLL